MRVIWSPAALADIARIYDYISLYNPPAAQRLFRRLFERAEELVKFPFRGRPAGIKGERELTVVPPYVIVYEVQAEAVRILRIWHGAQLRP